MAHRFRLLVGKHIQKDADGVEREYDAMDPNRCIVPPDVGGSDLTRRFGADKFERLVDIQDDDWFKQEAERRGFELRKPEVASAGQDDE